MKKIFIGLMALAIVALNAPVAAFALTADVPGSDNTTLDTALTIPGDDTTLDATTTPPPSDDTTLDVTTTPPPSDDTTLDVTTPTGDDTTLDIATPSGDDTTLDATSTATSTTPSTNDEGVPTGDDTTLNATSTATTTPTTTPATTNTGSQHAATDPNVGQSGGGGGGGFSSGGGLTIIFPGATPAGTVLGASTDDAAANCSISFKNYMKKGQSGNDVKALQAFLNAEVGAKLPVTGYFGNQTFAAVKAFQLKHATEILGPWVSVGKLKNQSAATGYVYKTTLRKMNLIRCSTLNIPQIPASELK